MVQVTVQPSVIARNQAFGQSLLQQGLQAQPITHPLQGLSQLAQTAMGAFLVNRADRQERERSQAGNQALMALLGGGTPGAPASPDISALLQFAGQFPERSGLVAPLIQQRLEPPPPPPPLKLREIADETSPTGTRLVPIEEASGQPGVPRQEFRVETITDPSTGQSRTIMVRGRPGQAEAAETVSKPTRSKLEQGIATATTQLDRLSQIRENMDTRFLNLPEQFKQGGRALMERLGVELSPESQAELKAYTAFATSTRRNMNRILNELSGAAISPAEAKRLMAELPTVNDSPTQFMAKIDDAERAIQAAIQRNQQLLEGGVTGLEFDREGNVTNAPPLENFMEIPAERGAVEAGMGGITPNMSNEALIGADTSKMSLQELEAWNAEMDRRGL